MPLIPSVPAAAVIVAKSSMETLPWMLLSGVFALAGLYPARMPAAGSPEPVRIVPDVIVPKASTEASLVDGTTNEPLDGALLIATMPEAPEVIEVPAAVATLTLPDP